MADPTSDPMSDPMSDPTPSPPPRLLDTVPPRPLLLAVACVVLGGLLATWCGEKWTDGYPLAVAIMLPFALVGRTRRRFVALCDAARDPSPRARGWIALGWFVAAPLACLLQSWRTGRALLPLWHDEFSYHLQSVQLARGRLWYPQHPLADFFESFHTFVKPVYASIYWPGTALMNVPGEWLHLPVYAAPLAIYGGCVAATYLLATRLVDGTAALAAALMAAAVFDWNDFATREMAHLPVTLLAATMFLAWLRWRESPTPGRRLAWVAVVGAAAGWAAITRPVDAVAFALPVGLCLLAGLAARRRWRELAPTVLVGVAAGLPFLALLAVQNRGITGNVLEPAYVEYLRQSQPGSAFGGPFGGDDSATTTTLVPATTLPQKLDYYHGWLGGMREAYDRQQQLGLGRATVERLPMLFLVALAGRSFYAWMLLGLFAATALYRTARPALLVLAGVVPLFAVLYSFNPYFLSSYALPLGLVLVPLSAAGMRALEESGGPRLRPYLVTLLTGGVAVWAVVYAVAYPWGRYQAWNMVAFRSYTVPAALDHGRALVLSRYTPGDPNGVHFEPVYNSDVPSPDAARILWAHDLGPARDGEILRYYAARQPDRAVYLLVRPEMALHPLGDVPAALADFEAGRGPLADRHAPLPPATVQYVYPAD